MPDLALLIGVTFTKKWYFKNKKYEEYGLNFSKKSIILVDLLECCIQLTPTHIYIYENLSTPFVYVILFVLVL